MRHIAALTDDKVPRDAEFQFKDRAQALVNKWHTTIQSNNDTKTNGNTSGDLMDVDKPKEETTDAPNGDAAQSSAEDALGEVSLTDINAGDLTVLSEAP